MTVLALLFSFSAKADVLPREKGEPASAFAARVKSWKEIPQPVSANLARFVAAYPAEIVAVEAEEDKKPVLIHLRNGAKPVFEDFAKKGFEQMLANADVNEMIVQVYPRELEGKSWPENLDPGRFRSTEFLKGVYGSSEEEVRKNLTSVPFCGNKVTFNKRNGASAALAAVGKELEALAEKKPELKRHLKPLGGTFNWRQVAGTENLSAHSFGVAIDLNPAFGSYWRWDKKGSLGDMARRTAYPEAIVKVFERHGFIWGGKWYHFDMMHFEFRPEFQGSNAYVGNGPGEDVQSIAAGEGMPKPLTIYPREDEKAPPAEKASTNPTPGAKKPSKASEAPATAEPSSADKQGAPESAPVPIAPRK